MSPRYDTEPAPCIVEMTPTALLAALAVLAVAVLAVMVGALA